MDSHKLFPVLCVIIFLGLSSYFLNKYFSVPGLIFSGAIALGLLNIFALFFTLGSKLSLVGAGATITGVFYALIMSFYFLNLLKKLFDVEFISKDNIFLSFKKNLTFAADVTLPLFIFSVLVAFFAPLHIREYGIVLSISILIYFIFIPICASSCAIKYTKDNFLYISSLYRKFDPKEDFIFNKTKNYLSDRALIYGFSGLGILILLAILIFSLTGVNSFSLFKKNYLLVVLDSKHNLNNALSKENAHQVMDLFRSGVGSKSYLIESSENIEILKQKLNLNGKDNIIQETNSFNDAISLGKILTIALFSLSLASVYTFIRFGFKNTILLWSNTFISLFTISSLIILLRITVYSSIFVALCSFFALAIIYHIYWFNSETLFKLEWFNRGDKYSFAYGIDYCMKVVACLFFVCFLASSKEELVITSFYFILAFFTIHYFSKVFFLMVNNKLDFLRDKFLWKKETILEGEESEVNSYDPYDEELISEINN
ncbi:hypothetical protein A6V39_02065 [Candidatus Mycoplasma haematobovis]|uniref:Uncharacterized protein n=1 Tax=Candidatus Mycoplasma haematobovis TaxID=432608 RepID=A0A1A9QDZ1_9MOLU|nr:preprotein translocase subunit SecD [Candidatus Mycoplasma haematobovis]OAL10211.1 hypothetical protein A6V39_02065 [Candidatus Mycoplasma haematobovis]